MNPTLTPTLFFGAIIAWFAASIVYRLVKGKPVFATAARDALFAEGWASGRCGSGLLARLSAARNCLHVQIAGNAIRISPHFPFTLGFIPETYSMDMHIPLEQVARVSVIGGHRTKAVEVVFKGPDGKESSLQLLLRGGEAFRDVLQSQASALDPRNPASNTPS